MTTRYRIPLAITLGLMVLVLVGCGRSAPQPPAQTGVPGNTNNPAAVSTPEKNNVEVGPNDPQIFMLEPEDDSSLTSPFNLRVGVANLKIPFSQMVVHIAIDATCAPAGTAINQDAQHVSFPVGRMENPRFNLPVGKHRLCIQAANQDHVALDGPGMVRVYDIEVVP